MTLVNHLFILTFICALASCDSKSVQTESQKTIEYIQDDITAELKGPKMVIIPKGSGTIGGEKFKTFQNEYPVHQITVRKPYAIGESEVTFEQYDAFCTSQKLTCPDDNGWGRGKQPLVNISWDEATAYTRWLSENTGQIYRLPSENEWEYAARAGKPTKFWWGDEYIHGKDHCDQDLGACPNGEPVTHPLPAGRFSANPFGLLDVTANVSEWVLDCANSSHVGAPADEAARLSGDCDMRMVKGSNWRNPQPLVHLSKRLDVEKDYKGNQIGFRVVREINANK